MPDPKRTVTHTNEPRGAIAGRNTYLPYYPNKDSNCRDFWRIARGHPGFSDRTSPKPTPDQRPTILVRNRDCDFTLEPPKRECPLAFIATLSLEYNVSEAA